jgi:hypothetical protein
MKRFSNSYLILATVLALAGMLTAPSAVQVLRGFYVGKSDTSLYNHASQVVMGRHEDKTRAQPDERLPGEPSQFALVMPVPEVLSTTRFILGDRELFVGGSTPTAAHAWSSTTTPTLARCR